MQNDGMPRPTASNGNEAIARTLSTLISAGQINTIRELSANINLKQNETSQKLFGCDYDGLSKSGADDVITELRKLQPEGSGNNILPFAKPEEVKNNKEIPTRLWQLQYMAKANMPLFIGRLENDWWKDDEFLVEGIEQGWIQIVPKDGFLITEAGKEIVRSHGLDMTPDNPPEYYLKMVRDYRKMQIRWAREERNDQRRRSRKKVANLKHDKVENSILILSKCLRRKFTRVSQNSQNHRV